ncbi:MAG TPA: MerR family transcriptional regulator [Roseovarius sp.]|nr:MerR family transcriptional regulator [Roseovarius sp.]
MSLDEYAVVARVQRLNLRDLRFWVRQGWICPTEGEAGPLFDELDIARVRLLCDLRKEMSLPNEAMPVVLNLIDHLHRTRRELRALTRAIEEQPEHVQHSIVSVFHGIHVRTTHGDEDHER